MSAATARTKANRKYNEKTYDRLAITVPKGQKKEISEYADSIGLSLNAFVNVAIQEKMQTNKSE